MEKDKTVSVRMERELLDKLDAGTKNLRHVIQIRNKVW